MAYDYAGARAAGLTDQEINNYLQSKRMKEASAGNPLINRLARGVGSVFLPRTTATAQQIGAGIGIGRMMPGYQQSVERAQSRADEILQMAKRETNPARKEQLLAQSRAISQGVGEEVSGLTGTLQKTIGKETPYWRQGLGFYAEVVPYILGNQFRPGWGRFSTGSPAVQYGLAQAGQAMPGATNLLSRIAAAGVGVMPTSFAYGATSPEAETVGEAGIKGLQAMGTSALTSAAMQAGGETLKKIAGSGAAQQLKQQLRKPSAASRAFLSKFVGIPHKLFKRLRPIETAEKMMDYRVTGSLDDIALATQEVTGGDGAITKITRNAIGYNNAIVGNLDEALEAASQQSKLAERFVTNPNQLNSVKVHVAQMLGQVQESQLTPNQANALDVYDLIKDLETQGYSIMGKSTYLTPRPDMEALADVYLAAADQLQDQLEKSIGDAAIQAAKDPAQLARLQMVSPKLAEEVIQAKTIDELRALASPFVRMSQMIEQVRGSSQSVFGNWAQGMQGKPSIWNLLALLGNKILQSEILATGGGAALQRMGGLRQGMGKLIEAPATQTTSDIIRSLAQIQSARAATGE